MCIPAKAERIVACQLGSFGLWTAGNRSSRNFSRSTALRSFFCSLLLVCLTLDHAHQPLALY